VVGWVSRGGGQTLVARSQFGEVDNLIGLGQVCAIPAHSTWEPPHVLFLALHCAPVSCMAWRSCRAPSVSVQAGGVRRQLTFLGNRTLGDVAICPHPPPCDADVVLATTVSRVTLLYYRADAMPPRSERTGAACWYRSPGPSKAQWAERADFLRRCKL
jgi:hypothetical protein